MPTQRTTALTVVLDKEQARCVRNACEDRADDYDDFATESYEFGEDQAGDALSRQASVLREVADRIHNKTIDAWQAERDGDHDEGEIYTCDACWTEIERIERPAGFVIPVKISAGQRGEEGFARYTGHLCDGCMADVTPRLEELIRTLGLHADGSIPGSKMLAPRDPNHPRGAGRQDGDRDE